VSAAGINYYMVITDDSLVWSISRELLARACAGEAEAFCLLTQPLRARLLRQAVVLAGDVSAAEDLVSETLVEAWKSLPRYNQTCRLSTWLYAILLHRHRKSVRRARSRPLSLAWLPFFEAREFQEQQAILPSTELSPAEMLAQNETVLHLKQCLELLPEKHRQIILLRFFEDASLSDMAAVLGCSVGTVKSRLHHALEKLRKMKMNLPNAKGDTQL
jgi:RNA polymerase sigma-70 factor (ECF subfamily)